MPKSSSTSTRDTAHQWIFSVLYELTPAQAADLHKALGGRGVPSLAGIDSNLLPGPGVFCWRCLAPFSRATAKQACRGGARYEAEQVLLAAAVTNSAAGTKKQA